MKCLRLIYFGWLSLVILTVENLSLGADVISPKSGRVIIGSFMIVVDPPESEITKVELFRAWPVIGGFWSYRLYENIHTGSMWFIDEDDVTCGEYQAFVTLTDGSVIYSELFVVYTPTPLIQIWLPDQFSRAAPGDSVILLWDYFGLRFKPTSDFASAQITGPKLPVENDTCETNLNSGLTVFGPGRVKWLVPTNCHEGLYTITVTQLGRPDNTAVASVYVESRPTVRPELRLSKIRDGFYSFYIGKGTRGPWAFQYSQNAVDWDELPGHYESDSYLTILSSGKMLYFRLRRH